MPTLDIDRETAHDAAAGELAKAVYPRPSLTERLAEWVNDLLYRLMLRGSEFPGGWFTIVVLALLVVAAVIVAVRIARRAMANRATARLYGTRALSAEQHRSRADHHAAQGQWAAAIRQRLRAVGRQLEEDGVLPALPGRTAGEFAREASSRMPELSNEFLAAATIFNDVTYGGRPGGPEGYRTIVELDHGLRGTGGSATTTRPGADLRASVR